MIQDTKNVGLTQKLSAFIVELQYERLPQNVVDMVKKCLLDYYGCALFATQTDMGKIIIDFCKQGNNGYSTILPDFKQQYNPVNATLVNASCAHGFEIDDVSSISISHPGACIIPAVIALAEERGISGRRVIEAIVTGYEVMIRVGSSIVNAHINKGFHPTGTFGTFGATAACCKLLGLTLKQTENAFGIAGSMASGLMQFSLSGSMVKRIHAGKAAQQGVMISQLAEKGFTGPTDIFEGKFGFCQVFRDDNSEIFWEKITHGLGKSYEILNTTFKPFSCCDILQSSVECINQMKLNPAFDVANISKIVVLGNHNLTGMHNTYQPNSILAAQYSLPFTLAMTCLGYLNNPTSYLNEDIIKDSTILNLALKVETKHDSEGEDLFPEHFSSEVHVFLEDGVVLKEKIKDHKGSSANPLSYNELYEKYRKLCSNVISKELAEELSIRINKIEQFTSIRDFTDNLFKL